MNSFYLIDKPLGLTSFDVIRKLKKILNTSRIGHAGTLDPLASGLLLIAVGEYTKLLSFILLHDKVYEFTISLDGESDSFDMGTPIRYLSQGEQAKSKENITLPNIQNIISASFLGSIMQIPPKYSALKVEGEKALFRAKAGEAFELKAREVTIYSFDILDFNYPKLSCRAHVSSGTYIRSFAHDLGEKLGTGGYISALRRTNLGSIDIANAQTLENFSPEKVVDESSIFQANSFITLENSIVERLKMGQRIRMDADFIQNSPLFLRNQTGIYMVCNYDGRILSPVKILHI